MENIWIQLRFNNYCTLDGKDELVKELSDICTVQVREEHYAAACTGMEFAAIVLIKGSLADFVKDMIIAGAAWDLTKKALKAVWNAFNKFVEKNERLADLQHLELTFNDATIKINGVLEQRYGYLLKLFQSFPEHWNTLEKLGIDNISEIELPFELYKEDEDSEPGYIDPMLDTPEEKYLWKVCYLWGCDSCYYNPYEKRLV